MMSKELKDIDEIALMGFINARGDEMKAMLDSKQRIIGNNLPQQQLPRHMRRRAASHKVNRLPIRLRERYLHEQSKCGAMKITKCPSRKFRRQPKNIFNEFARRKNNGYWLETHVWHSRRFHVDHKWGWKIPMHRSDRGIRAAYREAQYQCLIQDISYTTCIEIKGKEIDIVNNLNQLIGQNTGPSFDSASYIDGCREGQIYLYKRNLFPYSAIGPASFLWQTNSNNDICRTLWLFSHPSYQYQILSELESLTWSNESSFKLLSNELCHFRLMGPNALKLLKNVLCDYNNQELVHKSIAVTELCSKNKKLSDILNPCLSPDIVIGSLVSDPRIYLPQKRISTWNIPEINLSDQWIEPNPDLSNSQLWLQDMRILSRHSKALTFQFNQLRERFLSSESLISAYNPAIPILIIGKNFKNSSSNLNQQWHLITPSGWGMYFWIALIYGGGSSIGETEYSSLCRESKQFAFPCDYPDTNCGEIAENELGLEAFKKYCRRPPAKRCNYSRCGVVSMFGSPWSLLFNNIENNPDTMMNKRYFVLRDATILNELKNKLGHRDAKNRVIKCSIKKKLRLISDIRHSNIFTTNCLVPVIIESYSRGLPKRYAGIYLMLDDDYKQTEKIKQIPFEPTDLNNIFKHKEFKSRTKLLKNKSSVKNLKNIENMIDMDCENNDHKNYKPKHQTKIIEDHELLKINWQWNQNERFNDIRNICSRQLIGFVSSGGFSQLEGGGFGLGFVTIEGIKNLIDNKDKHNINLGSNILFRNTTSYIYHKAVLNVLN